MKTEQMAVEYSRRRSAVIEEFFKEHMRNILPDELKNCILGEMGALTKIHEFMKENGIHAHSQGDWIHIMRGKCGEEKCERIASLYIEMKFK